MKRWFFSLLRLAFYAAVGAGAWLMSSASWSYLELGSEHPFLLEKLPLSHPALYRTALYVHVPSALFALPACLVLLPQAVRSHFPRIHRWLGRVTGALLLLAVVPSGLYLAFFAQGGLVTTLGFWATGLITFFAMLQSIRAARARDMSTHRRMSTHVAAQLCVAVVSRVLLMTADDLGFYATWVYVAALWVPVIGCALIAELALGTRSSRAPKGSRHEALAPAPARSLVSVVR